MGYKDSKLGETLLSGKRKNPLDDILTEEILAIIMGCSTTLVATWRNKQALPFMKIGRDYYYSAISVKEWFLSHQTTNGADGENQKKVPLTKSAKGSETQAI